MKSNFGKKGRTLSERFLESVHPEPNTGCWLWSAGVNACGYGTIGVRYKSQLAHRISYELHVGAIPEGINVLHRCDVPCCVNPEHLFLGTQKDNVLDMESKNRALHYKGSEHGRAKLTEADVIFIRQSSQASRSLAVRFGVSKHTVLSARSGKTWGHLCSK